jgi:hypothetical protein
MVALAKSIEYEGLEGVGIFPFRPPARCNVWRYLERSMPYQCDCLGVIPQQRGSAMILVEIAAQERLTEAVLLLIRLVPDSHLEVGFPLNWLRVLGTAELPHIDQGVCHQLHAKMSLLQVFKPQEQPLECILPRKGPINARPQRMDGGIE